MGAPGDTPVIISMQCQSIRLAQSNVMVNDLGWSFSPLTPGAKAGNEGQRFFVTTPLQTLISTARASGDWRPVLELVPAPLHGHRVGREGRRAAPRR